MGDIEYIKKIAKKRLKIIRKKMLTENSNIYFDVSKFYARGLYLGLIACLKIFCSIIGKRSFNEYEKLLK